MLEYLNKPQIINVQSDRLKKTQTSITFPDSSYVPLEPDANHIFYSSVQSFVLF